MQIRQIAHVLALLFLMGTATSGCVYRFTNRHVSAPSNIKSIAVEAIYDTSKEVLPHELLWDAIQKSIARDGHLKLAAPRHADAIILTHIYQASVGATGSITAHPITQDPNVTNPETVNPSQFRDLQIAGETTSQEQINVGVEIRVIDLRTQKVLLNKRYTRNQKFKSARAGSSPNGFFLIYDEALRNKFRLMSESIASAMLDDLFIRKH